MLRLDVQAWLSLVALAVVMGLLLFISAGPLESRIIPHFF